MATDAQHAWNNGPARHRPPNWAPVKLTGQQRDDIRARLADGERIADLAIEYRVSSSTIRRTTS